jgi:hypothetical protein
MSINMVLENLQVSTSFVSGAAFATNHPTVSGCEACTTSRPEDYVVPPPGPLDTLPRTAGPVQLQPVIAAQVSMSLNLFLLSMWQNEL